jgi:hypothetical protein
MIELTVDKSSFADIRLTVTTSAWEAEESPMLEATTVERLLDTAGWEKD